MCASERYNAAVSIATNPRDRIKLWCLVHRKKQVDLAKAVGVPKQEIAHVATGRYKSGRVVEATAKAMGCDLDWLVHGLGKDPAWLPPSGTNHDLVPTGAVAQPILQLDSPRNLPLIGTAGASDAGQRGLLFTDPEIRTLSGDLALVEVHGRSAYPVAYDGQLAVVNLKRPARPNNIVVVVMGDGREVLVKRWCPQHGGQMVVLASPDGGRDSLVVRREEVVQVWPVVGVLFEAM